ncbi:MAG: hypothetical protein CMH64_02175 [Nanoarchaeota archaeon]|nr:hypothetical protein [Nanoarchaeota archaeon]
MDLFRKNVHGKRGQAEIFGLIIIVVLLIFAFLFFVKVKQDDSSNVVLRSNFRANNLMNAIMNVNFGDDDMKELLKKCLDKGGRPAPECNVPNDELTKIFEKTLLEFEKFEFKGTKGGAEFTLPQISDCLEGITASPVRLRGNYMFTLKLCS